MIEHPAYSDTVRVSTRDAEPDEASSKNIHDDHHPIALQQNRFTPKEVNTPETVFRMTNGRQLGNAIAIGLWPIVLRQDPTHHILVDRDLEGMRNRLKACLKPYPSERMLAYPVSKAVNDPKNDQPELIARAEKA